MHTFLFFLSACNVTLYNFLKYFLALHIISRNLLSNYTLDDSFSVLVSIGVVLPMGELGLCNFLEYS